MKKLTLLLVFVCSISFAQEISFADYQLHYAGEDPHSVATADINGDGLLDVILATGKYFSPETDNSFYTFFQNESGQLENISITRYNPEIDANRPSLKSFDFNNDDLDDIVIGFEDSIKIFQSLGDGSYNVVLDVLSGDSIDGVAIDDIDNDGFIDIAVSHWNDDFFKVYWGSGDFDFSSETYFSEASGWDQIVIAKVGTENFNSVLIYKGQGSNRGIEKYNFSETRVVQSIDYYQAPDTFSIYINIADRNNDNSNEIIASCNSPEFEGLAFFDDLNSTDPTSSFDVENSGFDMFSSVDLNLDGRIDFIAPSENHLYIINNEIVQDFLIPASSHIWNDGMVVEDINNDGLKDVLIASSNHGLVVLYNQTQVTLGNDEFDINSNFSVYPNPTVDSLSISGLENIDSVSVHSMAGKKVLEFNGNMDIYNISKLKSGTYIVCISVNKKLFHKKIIKK